MRDPLLRAPIGPPSAAPTREPESPVSNRVPRSIVGLLEELQRLPNDIEIRRVAWNMARCLPDFTLARTRARILALAGCVVDPSTAVVGFIHLVGSGPNRNLHVGEGSIIGPGATFCLDAPITLGKGVSIGPRAVLYTATHPLGFASRRMQLDVLARPIWIDDGAWVGLGATILAGVRIGRGSVVSAGAVVGKDVPPNVIVAGNPATVVTELSTR